MVSHHIAGSLKDSRTALMLMPMAHKWQGFLVDLTSLKSAICSAHSIQEARMPQASGLHSRSAPSLPQRRMGCAVLVTN
jgi:hypothetical protein